MPVKRWRCCSSASCEGRPAEGKACLQSIVTFQPAGRARSFKVIVFWMGIGLTLIAGAVVTVFNFTRRSGHGLGTVSDLWMAQHRGCGPDGGPSE